MLVRCRSVLYLSANIVMIFFFKQKTAYEMRISDWSSDVCSSDLKPARKDIAMAVRQAKAARRATTAVRQAKAAKAGSAAAMQWAMKAEKDRKSVMSGKRVSGRVDQGRRRMHVKKTTLDPDVH